MDTAFEKDTASCAMDKGFICIKAILKYRHGSFPQSKLSRELAKQAVITKCRGYIHAEPKAVSLKKPWISVPKKICDNLWTIIQATDVFFIDHRLSQIGTD